ncbi:MAG: acyl--CoA ligase [Ilumatobacteraceae bacterium]|nr:acyl--CoA ligase [Ilumatobacteraceae bacterium]
MTLRERTSRVTPELIKEYYALGAWLPETYLDLFEKARHSMGGESAVLDARREITFGDLGEAIDVVAGELASLGLSRGSVLGVECVNEAEFIVAHLAAAAVGAVTLSLPGSLSDASMAILLENGDADAMICSSPLAAKLAQHLDTTALPVLEWDHERLSIAAAAGADSHLSSVVHEPDDDAIMMPTAGTTGTPKLALRSQNSWLAMGRKKLDSLGDMRPRAGETTLIMPAVGQGVGYIHGFITPLLVPGLRRVLMSRFSVEAALDIIEAERPAVVVGVPAQLMMMMASPNLESRDLSSVRYVQTGGDHMPPDKRREFEECFGAPVLIDYGASDVGAACAVRPDDPDDKRFGTCGLPMKWTEIRIDAGSEAVGPGITGEVKLRAPDLISGYYPVDDHDPSKAFFATGDLGYCDNEGYLVITGRMKDVIIRGGLNISPSTIENALVSWPLIDMLAVVGVPDPILGERIGLFCTVSGDPDQMMSEIADQLRSSELARQQWPELVYFVDELPLSPGGKIQKAALRKQVADGLIEGRPVNAS